MKTYLKQVESFEELMKSMRLKNPPKLKQMKDTCSLLQERITNSTESERPKLIREFNHSYSILEHYVANLNSK